MRTSMRWLTWAVFGLAVGLLASAAKAEDKKADANGTWKWSFTTQSGQTFEQTLKLKQEGERLTGTITGRMGNEIPIEEGKVQGDEVSFQVTREFGGNKVVQKYRGKLSGDTIKGKVEMERNGETRSRDWEAKRS
ncbi:MAG: hypothetical protein IRY99_17115 [Isosphaeraceae bacterium]|nr:hypothetical protein [Isosphaeraceae bacterium]